MARGEAGVDSDVDVVVLYGKTVEPGLVGLKLGLAGDLEDRLGRRVDLVVLDNQSPDLVHRVLRDGLLVLENDRSARIRFEVTARNEYFDVLPIVRMTDQDLVAKKLAFIETCLCDLRQQARPERLSADVLQSTWNMSGNANSKIFSQGAHSCLPGISRTWFAGSLESRGSSRRM